LPEGKKIRVLADGQNNQSLTGIARKIFSLGSSWAGFAALTLLVACTTLVVPPAAPTDVRPVFLLEHGQHSSLVLPGESRGIVRYSYGDWNYYVLGDKSISSGLRALSGPTLAGLGRRELNAAATQQGVRTAVRVPVLAVHELQVEASAIQSLRAKLDGIYRTNIDTLTYNPDIDLEFVHHPTPYSAEHNSNRVVADWLKDLGCEVTGPTFVPNWKFAAPKKNASR
jgi:hypothetical protein